MNSCLAAAGAGRRSEAVAKVTSELLEECGVMGRQAEITPGFTLYKTIT